MVPTAFHPILPLLIVLAGAIRVPAGAAVEPGPLRVVTGNTIVHDIAIHIGGARIAATCLLQAGVDPHTYQPVPEDVKRLAEAQVVIINGLGFEGWFEGLAREAGYRGATVIASAGIEPLKMRREDEAAPAGPAAAPEQALVDDPHAFNSIINGVRYAENIRDALIAADAQGAAEYRARAGTYIAQLRQLDAWARKAIASLPPDARKLVTNHDALQYFARDYGFEIRAPNTALEDSQPSARDLADLIRFIEAQGVKAVFLEAGRNEKVIAQIAAEAGVRIGAPLFLDGLGPAGSPARSYADMFRSNVAAIVAGLR